MKKRCSDICNCAGLQKQYKAKYIIAAISFYHYRRQDRPEKKGEIQRNLWFAEMLKANSVDSVIVATPHSDQTQKNCEVNGLQFRAVDQSEAFASVLRPLIPEVSDTEEGRVYSPDEGSIPRAIALAKFLGIGVLFNLKDRAFNNETAMAKMDKKRSHVLLGGLKRSMIFMTYDMQQKNGSKMCI